MALTKNPYLCVISVFDICKHVEHGGDISDLNDLGPVVLSRLVKFYLLRQREIDQARISAKLEKHNKSETPTGKGGKKSPAGGAPKGKGSKAASAKGKVFHRVDYHHKYS